MPDILEKLSPHRDLQCYFFRPSAIAAITQADPNGFTVSGTWRQQFDWAVIEWNRDNVYEHPLFRYLPDGDLSGLSLTYEETRENCIALDSDLYPTVDWPSLRVWAGDNGAEQVYYVPLHVPSRATPIEGAYQCAYADFTLSGTITGGDYIGIAALGEHHTYQLYGSDTLESAVQAIADSMNAFSSNFKATCTGATIRVYFTSGASIAASTAGANGNRVGVYSYTAGANTQTWDAAVKTLAGGTSPTKWRIALNFANLMDRDGVRVPTEKVRKLRWTYAADLQAGAFARSEFQVVVSNWTVTGGGREYRVAGPKSVRIEDSSALVDYSSGWTTERGNYSGGTLHRTQSSGASLQCNYTAASTHTLYLGTRYTGQGATAQIGVDGQAVVALNTRLAGEDTLFRRKLGDFSAGTHTVTLQHSGPTNAVFYFDFLELVVPATELPVVPETPVTTLATDWDTDHSLALAPERTAWMIDSLGFRGRQNHYVGALWFYELTRKNHQYASGTVTFGGTPDPNSSVTLRIGRVGEPSSSDAVLTKLIHVGLTAELLAAQFAQEINRGYTAIRAQASGGVLTVFSRAMGGEGNLVTMAASTNSANLTIALSGTQLTGGVDGTWITDLTALPRTNRAARGWTRGFFTDLHARGIDAVAAFSTELQHGDPALEAGIAQRGPAGDPVVLPTPAVQTNFSPASRAFWQQVHAEMAGLQSEAGMQPYLQFGEVQWWYFPNDGLLLNYSGMPFYDDWTKAEFQQRYGRPLPVFTHNHADPAAFPEEVQFLGDLLGEYTTGIMQFVRTSHPTARFEVLYPTDVNSTNFNQRINYPEGAWTPAQLDCLKTESLGFTFSRALDQSMNTVRFGAELGFTAEQRSHLVGIGDATAPWLKEARYAQGRRCESVVLFALDQYCLIGYPTPWPPSSRRSVRSGS